MKNIVKSIAGLALGSMSLLGGMSGTSQAFFEKTDRTEVYLILPNESAFWIPDNGANKDTQTKMDSEAYLEANKLSVKRFVIPHQKLQDSAGSSFFSGWDYYVPTGRLILVDRTPYSREWVDATDRGTSSSKQGFPCQTKEGLNVTVGVSIGTSVLEDNASKFLYHFGVRAATDNIIGDQEHIESDGKIIFASVYRGRSLSDVMDDVGRKKVQTLVCNEISKRTFEEANAQAVDEMTAIEVNAKNYFNSVGIQMDFIGWADTFSFDKEVQDAIDRRYVAQQDQQIAEMLKPYASIIQSLAEAEALRSFGKASDGKLPTTIVGLPSGLIGLLGSLLTTAHPEVSTTPVVAK